MEWMIQSKNSKPGTNQSKDRALRINHMKKGAVEKETVGRWTNDYEEETEGNTEARGRMYVKNWRTRVGSSLTSGRMVECSP